MARRLALLAAAFVLPSACATAQMHSEEQLNAVAQNCGLSVGEVMQDASEKRLLFLMRSEPSARSAGLPLSLGERGHMHLVIVNIAKGPAS